MAKKRKINDPSKPVMYHDGILYIWNKGRWIPYRDYRTMWISRIALIVAITALIWGLI